MWCELRAGRDWMLQSFQGRGDIAGHRDVHKFFVVVPFNGKATVILAFPIDCNFVVRAEGLEKVIGIVGRKGFDTKVIDTETKFCGARGMGPETCCVRARTVTVWSELTDKVLVGKDGCLLEAVHASFDLDVDVIVWCKKSFELVLGSDRDGKILVFEAHILWVFHGRSEKEIF
jgi:hypothetical protein